MGEKAALARMNEVAAYLDKNAPGLAQELNGERSDLSAALETGIIGGAPQDDRSSDEIKQSLVSRARILDLALNDLMKRGQADQDQIDRTLRSLRKTRTLGAVCSAVASSGVLATAFSRPIIALVAGILGLVSNLASLLAEQLFLGQKGSEAALREIASGLTSTLGESRLTQALLAGMNARDWTVDEMNGLIAQSNAIFGRINELRSGVARMQ